MTVTSTGWTEERVRQLRLLYPNVKDERELELLADQLGVTPTALVVRAKREKLRRPRADSRAREFTDADDDLLRARMPDSDEPAVKRTAAELKVSAAAVRQRWDELERRRRARIGDWTEAQLADAVDRVGRGEPVNTVAAELGVHADDLRLKLLALGVAGQRDEEQRLSLRQAADKLSVEPLALVQLVVDGRLSAEAPADGSAPLPCEQWVTSDLKLGALLVASPELLDLRRADPVFVLRVAAHTGLRIGSRLNVT